MLFPEEECCILCLLNIPTTAGQPESAVFAQCRGGLVEIVVEGLGPVLGEGNHIAFCGLKIFLKYVFL